MKKHLFSNGLIIALLVISISVVGVCLLSDFNSIISKITVLINANKFEQRIKLFDSDGVYYAFLPSYADLSSMELEAPDGYEVIIDNEKYTGKGFFSNFSLDTEHHISVKTTLSFMQKQSKIVFVKSEHIPTLSISLLDGNINEINNSNDKSVEKTGTCSLVMEDSTIDYNGPFKSLKGRGNTTWGMKKKPYNISFSNEVSLLNFGESKKFCLLSNPVDRSNLRNKIVYDAAKKIGLSNAVDSDFVDLYIDNEYMGLYLLTDSIEIGNGSLELEDLTQKNKSANDKSLNGYSVYESKTKDSYIKCRSIPNNPTDISGGYLIETEAQKRNSSHTNVFVTPNDNYFCVKSPDYASPEEMQYILGLFCQIENTNDKILNEIIDFDSWIKLYLLEEVFGNTDSGSYYFYKNADGVDPLVYAGPAWDFDMALGQKNTSPYQFYVKNHGIYKNVFSNPVFREETVSYYINQFLPVVEDIIENDFPKYETIILSSYKCDRIRWKYIDDVNLFGEKVFQEITDFDSLQGHIDYFTGYLNNRISFLNTNWISDEGKVSILFASHEIESYNLSAEYNKGTTITTPVLSSEKAEFEGWLDSETGEVLYGDITINSSRVLLAKWRDVKEGSTENAIKSMLKNYDADFVFSILVSVSALAVFLFILICNATIVIRQDFNHGKKGKHKV